jgi:hypothetical protein
VKPTRPIRIQDVNERSAAFVTFTHLDRDRALSVPTAVRYRIDCLTHEREILAWTSIASPAAENTVTVTSEQNRIIESGNERERRQLIVETTSSGGALRYDLYAWDVVKIYGVT